MHEMSIISGIIDIANNEIEKAKANYLESIELDIGNLSGVQLEALEFAWEVSIQETNFRNAELKVNKINAEARCINCNHIFTTNYYFQNCPECNEIITEIIKGKELKIKALTVKI